MAVLGVPNNYFIFNLFITLLLTSIIFYPAITAFGNFLFGTEDMNLFLWLFWHYENAMDQGKNPMIAEEVFYPEGISLSRSATSPFQSLIFWLLPDDWGAFGKITFLQILSFVLGGVFAFSFVYHFTKSFLPSLFGSCVFNFSIYHFEKVIHHLNYSMAFPLLALFFLCYFYSINKSKDKLSIISLSISFFLLAFNEITVAIMAGFIIFLDIIRRYFTYSDVKLFTPKNSVLFAFGIISSIVVYLISFYFSFPPILLYSLPSIPFIFTCFYLVGFRNLFSAEIELGFFRLIILSGLPIFAYLLFLFIQPSYSFQADNVPLNILQYSMPLDYLMVPSNFQAISHLGLFEGLPAYSETGFYLGLAILLLFILSLIIRGASKEEVYFRDLFLLCLFFSFPLLRIGEFIFAMSPFIAQTLFPMLSVLRVPSRFMIFALLFLAIMVGLLVKRLLAYKATYWKLIIPILLILLLIEQWPISDHLIFDKNVPSFYSNLNKHEEKSIFLYPNFDYQILLRELYYQTIHNQKLSWGIVSRVPIEQNRLFSLYLNDSEARPETVVDYVKDIGYDYILVQKQKCLGDCFDGTPVAIETQDIEDIKKVLEKDFEGSIFEDDSIIVYSSKR